MGKKENIVKEKRQKSIPKYTGSIQRLSTGATKKTEKDNKKQPPPTQTQPVHKVYSGMRT